MYDDPLEDLAQLRDRADSLAQKMAAVQGASAAFTGSDRSGTISVTVESAGHVRDVTVSRDWRERIGAEDLAGAVQEAVEAAATARLELWGDAFIEQDQSPDPRARPMPLAHETAAYELDQLATNRLTSSQGRRALEELLAMAEAIERGIDQVSAQLNAHLDARYTGRSRPGHVAVTVTGGGGVAEVRYDRRWLGSAHEINIGRETTEAFQAAQRQAGQHTVVDMVAQSPLGEIQALSQDPLGLARRLYLRND